MIEKNLYIKKIYLLALILIVSNFSFAQQVCNPLLTLESITNPGIYNVASLTESDGIRNGPEYSGATVYYPTNGTGPFPIMAIVPGFISPQSSIQAWGPFLASHGIVTMTIGTNSGFDQPPARKDALLDAIVTLKGENTRAGSPLVGQLDTDKVAVGGWSMGGGGAQLAAAADPSIKAVMALCPWLSNASTTTLNHAAPVLIFSAELDIIAPVGSHANIHYDDTPTTTDKLIYEIDNGGHQVANSPAGGEGTIGQIALSWLQYHLLGNDCYCPLVLDTPSPASKYLTNVICPEIILPVELTEFRVRPVGNEAHLKWETASETNNRGFEIEHSIDGRIWNNIGFVEGEGTTTEWSDYEFIHENPRIGENYYRLKQVDYDGDFEYSDIVNTTFVNDRDIIVLSPNPTNGIVRIGGIEEGEVKIMDASGRILKEQSINGEEINLSNLPTGIYFAHIISGNQSFSERIVKQ